MAEYICLNCGDTFTDFEDCSGDFCNRCTGGTIIKVDPEFDDSFPDGIEQDIEILDIYGIENGARLDQ